MCIQTNRHNYCDELEELELEETEFPTTPIQVHEAAVEGQEAQIVLVDADEVPDVYVAVVDMTLDTREATKANVKQDVRI